ncbi:MAG TPA: hypothetical protein VEX62_08735 [Candidatus Limnocylindrales bacterium]|nr:hypothetical protein [Candidatus Limnocylindrales bacterium]
MTATGLSATEQEYRERLEDQPDAQIDAWAAELMRDMSIRRGVRQVLADLRHAMGTNDAGLTRLFAAGGGPPAAIGHTDKGEMMVPAISLRYFVPGAHAVMPDSRARLIDYLVENFEEIVYI